MLSLGYSEIFEFLHEKAYTLDGISGTFEWECNMQRYPYQAMVHRLIHKPDMQGLYSETYLANKRKMGDDWVSDLSDNVDLYSQIAVELGYKWNIQ